MEILFLRKNLSMAPSHVAFC